MLGGLLTDGLGRGRAGLIGFGIMALGGMTLVGTSLGLAGAGVAGFLVGLPLMGMGHAVSMTALETLSVEVLPAHRDAATSLFNSLRFSGYALAPVLAGALFPIADEFQIYSLLTGVLALGAVSFWALWGLLRSSLPVSPAPHGESS